MPNVTYLSTASTHKDSAGTHSDDSGTLEPNGWKNSFSREVSDCNVTVKGATQTHLSRWPEVSWRPPPWSLRRWSPQKPCPLWSCPDSPADRDRRCWRSSPVLETRRAMIPLFLSFIAMDEWLSDCMNVVTIVVTMVVWRPKKTAQKLLGPD